MEGQRAKAVLIPSIRQSQGTILFPTWRPYVTHFNLEVTEDKQTWYRFKCYKQCLPKIGNYLSFSRSFSVKRKSQLTSFSTNVIQSFLYYYKWSLKNSFDCYKENMFLEDTDTFWRLRTFILNKTPGCNFGQKALYFWKAKYCRSASVSSGKGASNAA